MSERDWITEAHNLGQEHGANGVHNDPFNGGPFGLGTTDPERSDAYNRGYENGKNNPSSD